MLRVLQYRCLSNRPAVVKKFNRVLIANRGEIALRVMRTAKKMGIESVAVYSEPDKNSLHTKTADFAYFIGPAAATQSYLNMDVVIETALKAKAEAIHPGYGFLSENALFAEKCAEAGIVFIGPSSKAITDMGTKNVAKQIMHDAKVPVVEGFHGEDQSDANLKKHAQRIGYPVMLKAVYGGGGKGMRIAFSEKDFDEALDAARSEARKSFGRDEMLVEKFVERPRHVEVQVFGDHHGNYVHLWERDCSVQRRHQKIIEEAPAPNIDHATRLRLGESAVRAASAVKYVGAGTVEFILDPHKNFYFMEMNTRLQVEHPVTEAITGTDLVEWQLRVAQGEAIPLKQEEIPLNGHAFECRVYAEDTEKGAFMPTAGKIDYIDFPSDARVDSGVVSGDEVSVHYDPMIAKVITWGSDRSKASSLLDSALARTRIAGLPTNIAFVRRVLNHPEFQLGNVYTEFIPDHQEQLFEEVKVSREEKVEAALARALSYRGEGHSLFQQLNSFRVNYDHEETIQLGDESVTVSELSTGEWQVEVGGETVEARVTDIKRTGETLTFLLEAGGRKWPVKVIHTDEHVLVYGIGTTSFSRQEKIFEDTAGDEDDAKHAHAPMPGIVERILVKAGDSVSAGQALVVVVAMKMEYIVRATRDASVAEISCRQGQNVPKHAVLVKLQ